MSTTLDIDNVIRHVEWVLHQHGLEIQPFGHLKAADCVGGVRLQAECRQPQPLLADTMTLRDL